MKGRIELICGSMFSGKTEELLRRAKRAEIANQRVFYFKPDVDSRYSTNEIVSHSSIKMECVIVNSPFEISTIVLVSNARKNDPIDVVVIDEVQFFGEEIVKVCTTIADSGIRVIVAGLDMTFQGEPFGSIPSLMAVAETVTKVQAVCSGCGEDAWVSYRKTENSSVVLLGEKNNYSPLCRKCFNTETRVQNLTALAIETIHENR